VSGAQNRTNLDALDARLLHELDAAPRVGVLELSRRLRVARATAQARLDRLVHSGVIATFAPTLDPDALGYRVTAFATLEIRQGRGVQVLEHPTKVSLESRMSRRTTVVPSFALVAARFV